MKNTFLFFSLFRVLAVKESIKANYKICPKGNKN